MGESSKFSKLFFQNYHLKICNMPTIYSQFEASMVNFLKTDWIREPIIICWIQHFEADFLWKVSLQILNSGIILKLTPMYLSIISNTIHTLRVFIKMGSLILSLLRGDFCHLMITFANSLEPDQDWHSVSPDLDPNGLTLLVFPPAQKKGMVKFPGKGHFKRVTTG